MVVGLMLVGGCVTGPRGPSADAALEVAQNFARAWQEGDESLLPAEGRSLYHRFREDLRVVSARFEVSGVERRGDTAVATLRATYLLTGLGEWTCEGKLPLLRASGRWQARWAAAAMHELAQDGDRFTRVRTRPARAPLLDGRGQPLTHDGEVVTVGVDPQRVQSRAAVVAALEQQLGVDPARAERAVAAASTRFVPVIDLRPERYQQVRAVLAPIAGVFFKRRSARLSPYEGFAAATLGRTGEITAELLGQWGPLYQPGDVVGLSGLEHAFESSLAGSPSGEVRAQHRSGEVVVLGRISGREGAALRTTLLPELQTAADGALEGVTLPAVLVAVESQTGAILAVSNHPAGEALNRALTGLYPPGSTFKVVTAEALLASGMRPESSASCPATVTVEGKAFRNFEGEAFSTTTLRLAFARSCNTTFIALSHALGPTALTEAASRFGFGVSYSVGLPSPGATFPPPMTELARASAAIGQGQVLATPVHMASVAAAAETGVWHAPYLVAPLAGGPTAALTPGAREGLGTLMSAVITEGTGRAAAGAPGLCGKTGTAEFGRSVPPHTHAWFIGYQAGVSFAVLVEDGGAGGRVAAPLAAKFAAARAR